MEIQIKIPKEYISESQYNQIIESIDTIINDEGVPHFEMEYDEYTT